MLKECFLLYYQTSYKKEFDKTKRINLHPKVLLEDAKAKNIVCSITLNSWEVYIGLYDSSCDQWRRREREIRQRTITIYKVLAVYLLSNVYLLYNKSMYIFLLLNEIVRTTTLTIGTLRAISIRLFLSSSVTNNT